MALEDLTRYQHGILAQKLMKSKEDQAYIGGALYELASSLGIEDDARGFVQGAMASKQGIETTIKTYSKKYMDAFQEEEIGNLRGHYTNILEEYLNEDEVKLVAEEFGNYSEETFGAIGKKIQKANYVLEGIKKGLYKPKKDEKESAEKTISKYENIVNIINRLEDIKLEKLRPKTVKASQRQEFKEFIKENLNSSADDYNQDLAA